MSMISEAVLVAGGKWVNFLLQEKVNMGYYVLYSFSEQQQKVRNQIDSLEFADNIESWLAAFVDITDIDQH